MSFKEVFTDLDFKEFLKGVLIFAISLYVGINFIPEFSYVAAFIAAIGLIYVGYKSNTNLQASILGIIATLPGYVIFLNTTNPEFAIKTSEGQIIAFIGIIIIGAICGLIGRIYHIRSDKALGVDTTNQKTGKNKKTK
jgi:hypothetical protein